VGVRKIGASFRVFPDRLLIWVVGAQNNILSTGFRIVRPYIYIQNSGLPWWLAVHAHPAM
jgi:hypothetical protein